MPVEKPRRPNPGDTQYPYPCETSQFIIMKYGDGWGVYCNHGGGEGHMLHGFDDHPLVFPRPESCENLLRYMMDDKDDPQRKM